MVGPNAVLALAREGYGWGTVSLARPERRSPAHRASAASPGSTGAPGSCEMAGSLSKRRFVAAARRYVPELRVGDVVPGPSGIRAQALDRDGSLVDDFRISFRGPVVALRNAPSPGGHLEPGHRRVPRRRRPRPVRRPEHGMSHHTRFDAGGLMDLGLTGKVASCSARRPGWAAPARRRSPPRARMSSSSGGARSSWTRWPDRCRRPPAWWPTWPTPKRRPGSPPPPATRSAASTCWS